MTHPVIINTGKFNQPEATIYRTLEEQPIAIFRAILGESKQDLIKRVKSTFGNIRIVDQTLDMNPKPVKIKTMHEQFNEGFWKQYTEEGDNDLEFETGDYYFKTTVHVTSKSVTGARDEYGREELLNEVKYSICSLSIFSYDLDMWLSVTSEMIKELNRLIKNN